jgi:hypothetical protein
MDFVDRADETLSAVAGLAGHSAIDPGRIVLFGGSQGDWVAPAAAARSSTVAVVVTFSGPGVSPAVQEEYRIGRALSAAGLSAADVAAGVAYTRFMYDRLRAGDPAAAILRDLDSHPEVAWLPLVRAETRQRRGTRLRPPGPRLRPGAGTARVAVPTAGHLRRR